MHNFIIKLLIKILNKKYNKIKKKNWKILCLQAIFEKIYNNNIFCNQVAKVTNTDFLNSECNTNLVCSFATRLHKNVVSTIYVYFFCIACYHTTTVPLATIFYNCEIFYSHAVINSYFLTVIIHLSLNYYFHID